jgi:uncharacterized protein YijF (DUF1287 family)
VTDQFKYAFWLLLLLTPGLASAITADELVAAALERTQHQVRYDGSYHRIPYPMGDVPADIGVCTDVVIRSYRALGLDLQALVHQDIKAHFSQYPSKRIWGLSKPDSNIDHRRVPNLQTFFSRHGERLKVSDKGEDYQPGELVTWTVTGQPAPYRHSHRQALGRWQAPADSAQHRSGPGAGRHAVRLPHHRSLPLFAPKGSSAVRAAANTPPLVWPCSLAHGLHIALRLQLNPCTLPPRSQGCSRDVHEFL